MLGHELIQYVLRACLLIEEQFEILAMILFAAYTGKFANIAERP